MSTAGATLDRRPRFAAPESNKPSEKPRGAGISRLILPLAFLVFGGMLACATLGYVWARQTEAGHEADQRQKLRDAIEESHPAFRKEDGPAPAIMRAVERAAGLKELRFDTEPAAGGREAQTVVDPNGRILGWLSWIPDRPIMAILNGLWPLVGVTFLGLVFFVGLVVWQLRC